MRRTRPIAVVAWIGFASFVGVVVYGFGSIVLATLIPLTSTRRLLGPLRNRVAVAARRAPAAAWRVGSAAAIATVFFADHASGFTLADRPWLFERDQRPTTVDVLTPMQCVWFLLIGCVLSSALVALRRRRAAVAATVRPVPVWIAFAVPALLTVSEVGLYTGLRSRCPDASST